MANDSTDFYKLKLFFFYFLQNFPLLVDPIFSLGWSADLRREKNSPPRVDRQIESYFDGNQASESIEKSHWRRRRKNPIERKLRPIDFWGYTTMNMQHPSSAVFLLFSSFPGWLTGCNVRQCVGGKSFFPHISIGKPSDAKGIDVNALLCSNCKNPKQHLPQFTRLFESFFGVPKRETYICFVTML